MNENTLPDSIKKVDMVNHPPHYMHHPSGVECIDLAELLPYNTGCMFKYLYRRGHKDDMLQDLKKAHWYAHRELSVYRTLASLESKNAQCPSPYLRYTHKPRNIQAINDLLENEPDSTLLRVYMLLFQKLNRDCFRERISTLEEIMNYIFQLIFQMKNDTHGEYISTNVSTNEKE